MDEQEEAYRLALAAFNSVKHLRITQEDDGVDEDTPLTAGSVEPGLVCAAIFDHEDIDHGVRKGIIWQSAGKKGIQALICTFDSEGERKFVKRICYQQQD